MNIHNFKISFDFNDAFTWKRFLTVLDIDGRVKWQTGHTPLEFDISSGWVRKKLAREKRDALWFFIIGSKMTYGAGDFDGEVDFPNVDIVNLQDVIEECKMEGKEELVLKTMVLNG